jgi:hypothetical protein
LIFLKLLKIYIEFEKHVGNLYRFSRDTIAGVCSSGSHVERREHEGAHRHPKRSQTLQNEMEVAEILDASESRKV